LEPGSNHSQSALADDSCRRCRPCKGGWNRGTSAVTLATASTLQLPAALYPISKPVAFLLDYAPLLAEPRRRWLTSFAYLLVPVTARTPRATPPSHRPLALAAVCSPAVASQPLLMAPSLSQTWSLGQRAGGSISKARQVAVPYAQ
jgi:hypothetical protein